MLSIAYCSVLAAHTLSRYFFPRELKINETSVRSSVKSSKKNKGCFKFLKKCSLSTAKQSSSIFLSGNNTPAKLTTSSSSIDQRTLPQSADTLALFFPEKSSIIPSAEKTCPSTASSSAEPLDAQSNSSVENVSNMRSCIPGPSECHARLSTPSSNEAMAPTGSKIPVETSTAPNLPLDAQSNSSVETVNDVPSCIPGPSESHARPATPSSNEGIAPTGSKIPVERSSASNLALDAQSNSRVQTVNDVPSCIPGPSECQARPLAPSPNEAMVSTGFKIPVETSSASNLPLNAQSNTSVETVNNVPSCIPGPSECHARPSTPSSNKAMAPTGSKEPVEKSSASNLPLDAQSNSNVEIVDDVPSCIPGPLECHARQSTPSSNEDMAPTGSKIPVERSSASNLPLDAQSNANVETVNDVPGPSECQARPLVPSPNEAMASTGSKIPAETSSASNLPLDAQSNSSSVVNCQTGSQVLADAICECSTNVEGSCVVTTITETPSSDPSPPSGSYACQTTSSAPTCVPGSAAIGPPPAIPSLMSIQITPPPGWINYSPRFPMPRRHPKPRNIGASRPRRNTPSTRGGAPVRQPTPQTTPPTPIQTSPPHYNGIRPLANNGNGRGLPATSEIPPLMSIQTRPPWGTRPPGRSRPPRGDGSSRGARRPQARGRGHATGR